MTLAHFYMVIEGDVFFFAPRGVMRDKYDDMAAGAMAGQSMQKYYLMKKTNEGQTISARPN